jgi:hypothetical protein
MDFISRPIFGGLEEIDDEWNDDDEEEEYHVQR